MDVYVYQAELLCDQCGERARAKLDAAGGWTPRDPEDFATYDSNDYPKGPFPDSGGESDSPEHCSQCEIFLRNPLTTEGERWVRDRVREDLAAGNKNSLAIKQWMPYYDYIDFGILYKLQYWDDSAGFHDGVWRDFEDGKVGDWDTDGLDRDDAELLRVNVDRSLGSESRVVPQDMESPTTEEIGSDFDGLCGMTPPGQILVFVDTVDVSWNVRSWGDNRKKVDRYILSYRGMDDHEEYRKHVETRPGVKPRILDHGTSKQLEANANQLAK